MPMEANKPWRHMVKTLRELILAVWFDGALLKFTLWLLRHIIVSEEKEDLQRRLEVRRSFSEKRKMFLLSCCSSYGCYPTINLPMLYPHWFSRGSKGKQKL